MERPGIRGAARLSGIALALACASAAAQGDAAAGKRKTLTCNGCHGQSAMKAVPSLGGQTMPYFVAAMRAYQDGVRAHATMRDVAKVMSIRDFQDLAAHYAQPAASAAAVTETDSPARAESCAACHGPQGAEPATADVPRIAGQKSRYVTQVLREYRDGARVHPVMNEQARGLSDAEIDELARYFEGRAGVFIR